ncbi:Ribonuclease TUDOR 1 [Chlorella vulgaris]
MHPLLHLKQAPTKLHLTLLDSGSEEDDYAQSVNGQLLTAGLARLLEPKGPQASEAAEVLQALRECQEGARRKHVGVFEYGDPDSDDDGGFPTLAGKPAGGRGGGRR